MATEESSELPSSKKKSTRTIWAVVPAAGIGSRFGADIPKQYCQIHGKTILDISLSKMLAVPNIEGVVLALAKDDPFWPQSTHFGNPKIKLVDGGKERADSVLNGLNYLQSIAADTSVWVLVHDAARPCVLINRIEALIEVAKQDEQGAMLAVPVADTLKRSVQGTDRIEKTVSRENIWRGNTPQYFPVSALAEAIETAKRAGVLVTDEASAMEFAGYQPHLVADSATNIKVTLSEDSALAALYLKYYDAK